MILQSHEAFDTLGEFDIWSGDLSTFSRDSHPEFGTSSIAGTFGNIGDDLVLLFRLEGDLFLQAKGCRFPLKELHIELRPQQRGRTLTVRKGSTVIWVFNEPPTPNPCFKNDPTAFVEQEDFDYGLFLANIAGSPERQSRMFTAVVVGGKSANR